jgi:hypothetical protein
MPFRYKKPPEQQTDVTKIEHLHITVYSKQLAERTKKEY